MVRLIVERCRLAREQLVEEYGGLDGLFRKLETMDREREKSRAAAARRRRRSPADRKPQSASSRPSSQPAKAT
jgi:hypothetical protein